MNLNPISALPTERKTRLEWLYGCLLVIISAYFSIGTFSELSTITAYRHDDLYYLDNYTYQLRSDGRWLNYLFFDWLKIVPGWMATLAICCSFGVFWVIAAYQQSRVPSYSLLLSLLCLQIYPLYLQILWPATSLPAYLVLVLAALITSRLGIWKFYMLFGVLCFGTLSNIYYILPLLHLNLANGGESKDDVKTILFRIVSAWGCGFALGYLSMLAILYLATGQLGLELAEWRQPHFVHSAKDIAANIDRSAAYFLSHIRIILSDDIRTYILLAAIAIQFLRNKNKRHNIIAIISLAIIAAHYVIILPAGIVYSTRTAMATWSGIICLAFMTSSSEGTKWLWLSPLAVLLIFSFAKQNESALAWYATITNYWKTALLESTPLPPHQYNGLVFFSNDEEVGASVDMISTRYGVQQGMGFERLNRSKSWKPVAFEAGFEKVIICNDVKSDYCIDVRRRHEENTRCGDGLYCFYGVTEDGLLMAGLNVSGSVKEYSPPPNW